MAMSSHIPQPLPETGSSHSPHHTKPRLTRGPHEPRRRCISLLTHRFEEEGCEPDICSCDDGVTGNMGSGCHES